MNVESTSMSSPSSSILIRGIHRRIDPDTRPDTLVELRARLFHHRPSARTFVGDEPPGATDTLIPWPVYVERWHQYASCSDECFVLALVYVDRYLARVPSLTLTIDSVHRLVSTALVTAIKFHDDAYFMNAFYARIAGVTADALLQMELEFLQGIDFCLYIDADEYAEFSRRAFEPCDGGGSNDGVACAEESDGCSVRGPHVPLVAESV